MSLFHRRLPHLLQSSTAHMIQTGLIQNVHADLVTDASYDYYGLRLATCSLDQRIKVWQLDENNTWNVEDDWKAHDAAVSKLSWAHPEFGSIIASASFDRTVKIWEQINGQSDPQQPTVNGSSSTGSGFSRWQERAVLTDAKGTVRAVEFVPHHFGLKLATISTDNMLRIYECVDQPSLLSWQLTDELDVLNIAMGPSPAYLSRAHTLALATPTQTLATLDGASATLVAAALQQTQNTSSSSSGHGRSGNREADGGWCLSWCKDKYWGEIIAVGCGTTGVIKIIQINARRSTTILLLSTTPTSTATPNPTAHAHTSSNAAHTTHAPIAPTDTTSAAPTSTPSAAAASANANTAVPGPKDPSSTTSSTGVPPTGASASASTSTSTAVPTSSSSATTASSSTGPSGTGPSGTGPTGTGIGTGASSTHTNPNAHPNPNTPTYAITSVAWAPSCGRSYHLVATGSRDGHVRIWKVVPPVEEVDPNAEIVNAGVSLNVGGGESDGEDMKWVAVLVADFDQHKSAVGRVEWNITGTILSSAGNDGRIRLWKATSGNVWRPAGSVGVEETEDHTTQPALNLNSKDVEMDA